MKYKKYQKNLEARVKYYDNLHKSIQDAYTRPGSQHK